MKLHQNLPSQPGIYIYRGEQNEVLYVGKAKNLKKRVASYFVKQHADRPWTEIMIGLIKNVETIVVNSEVEALILEASLIKQYQPRFNIKMTDDKSYPYIKLTVNEEFPRFQIVRKRLKDKARYFGPYLSAWTARLSCELLRRTYGVHLGQVPIRSRQDRPCLNCQLEDNLCPLCGEISAEKYRENVDRVIAVLLGKRKELVRDVESKMAEASAKENFELAAKLRDQLNSLKLISRPQSVFANSGDDFDVVAVAQAASLSCLVLTNYREGKITQQHLFWFETSYGQSPVELTRQFLLGDYINLASEVSPLVILADEIEDQEQIEQFLSGIRGTTVEIRSAKRGEKLAILELVQKNAQSELERHMLKTHPDVSNLIALKELLNLESLPIRIEAVDISNLGASEAVGATVCFINGQADKNEYRRYKIKTVEGQNDFAMIEEITKRRFSDSSRPIPDLFVVDGGKEQLKVALKALAKTYQQPKVIISLAKKPDRVFLPGRKMPLSTPRGDKGLLLLARIRDEAHRFGLNYQRSRQRRRLLPKS